VFVLGNAGMDLSLMLPRLPAPGETLVAGQVRRAPGGKGLNQAVVAARAGARVRFAAPVGADEDAREIAAALRRETFEMLHLVAMPQRTDQSILMVAPDGENCIVTAGACANALAEEAARGFAAEMAPGDLLLVQGNLSLAATLAACAAAVGCGGQVMINVAPLRWSPAALLGLCDLVVVNESEAAGMTGAAGEAAAIRLVEMGARRAIVTLGAAGCVVADAAGVAAVGGVAADAVDTTGAGDTFCGMLAAARAAGSGWREAIGPAQRAAAITVTRHGAYAALPSATELRSMLTSATHHTGE
jgi:ribokinase